MYPSRENAAALGESTRQKIQPVGLMYQGLLGVDRNRPIDIRVSKRCCALRIVES